MQKKVGNTSLAYWKIVLLVLLISVYSDEDINILIFHLKKKIEKKRNIPTRTLKQNFSIQDSKFRNFVHLFNVHIFNHFSIIITEYYI